MFAKSFILLEVSRISRTFERKVITPTDDWSSEDTEIKTICDTIMTAERINAFKAAQESSD